MTDSIIESRPAATLVIVRDRAGAAPEILMLERSRSMAFAAGALVFPGGAVDERDRRMAAQVAGALPIDEAAARIGAIRETIEEAGLGLGFAQAIDQPTVLRLRDGLHDGNDFADLLHKLDLTLDLDALIPFARWRPTAFDRANRVFDARFYLARAQEGQVASVDATENVRLFWSSAADTLAMADARQAAIIYPTRRNLERIALADSYDALAAHAAAFPVEPITPWIETREGEPHLCIPDHLGYPVTAEPMSQVRRA